MRTIAVVTVARSDYGLYRSVLREIRNDNELRFHLIVSGSHLSSDFGNTIDQIRQDGFEIGDEVETLQDSDSAEDIAKSMGAGVTGFAEVYARRRPDILLVLGDRFEMHAATLAAVPFQIPIAHIHGGELTGGAIDDAFRHSMTKLSHLHFVATDEYHQRILQMGEEPWRVVVSGAPGLDKIRDLEMWSTEQLVQRYGPLLEEPPLLVTYHPVTLHPGSTHSHFSQVLSAISSFDIPIVFTQPNADTGGRVIGDMIHEFLRENSSAMLIQNLGTEGYFSMMSHARAMVGNSSSGLIEAPSFRLPVVNIGPRQQGRVRGRNVIDTECLETSIVDAIEHALNPSFRESLKNCVNPYSHGNAAGTIIEHLKVHDTKRLLWKRFEDLKFGSATVDSRDA